jgi:hypothetical protein
VIGGRSADNIGGFIRRQGVIAQRYLVFLEAFFKDAWAAVEF